MAQQAFVWLAILTFFGKLKLEEAVAVTAFKGI